MSRRRGSILATAAALLLLQMNHILCFSNIKYSRSSPLQQQNINQRHNTIHNTELYSIFNRRNSNVANANTNTILENIEDDRSKLRKTILGLTFPLFVAIGANAPFMYVILNPPTPEEREVMLMDFCKGDTCTLLGGGSGYTGGGAIDAGDMISSDALQALPSVEEFEAMARTAAEMADGII